jgi:hypothetical protein
VLDDYSEEDYSVEPDTPWQWAEQLRENPNAKLALRTLLDGGASLVELFLRNETIEYANRRLFPASELDYDKFSRCANFLASKLSTASRYQLGDVFLGSTTETREFVDELRRRANRAEKMKKLSGKRPALEPAIARAELVAYVKTATGQYYDEEVAALISVTLGCELSGHALAAWRGRPLHKRLIAKILTKMGTERNANKE